MTQGDHCARHPPNFSSIDFSSQIFELFSNARAGGLAFGRSVAGLQEEAAAVIVGSLFGEELLSAATTGESGRLALELIPMLEFK